MAADALPLPHHLHPAPPALEFDPDDLSIALPVPHAQQASLREQIRYGATGGVLAGFGSDPFGTSPFGGGDVKVLFGSVATRGMATSVTTRSITADVLITVGS